MRDYWNTVYCIVNYEIDQIAFIDRYIDMDGNETDMYSVWITYGHSAEEISDPDTYWIKYHEEGYSESGLTLAECFERITD